MIPAKATRSRVVLWAWLLACGGCSPMAVGERADADSQEAVALAARAVEAAGGAARLAALEGARFGGRFELFEDDRPTVRGDFETILVFPGRLYQSRNFGGANRLVRTLDREGGRLEAGDRVAHLDEGQREELKAYMASRYLSLLRLLATEVEVELDGEDTVDGATVEKLAIETAGGRVVLGIDPADGRLRSATGRLADAGRAFAYTQVFKAFETVDGIVVPMEIEGFAEGRPYSRRVYETVVIDPEVDPSLFAPPDGSGD